MRRSALEFRIFGKTRAAPHVVNTGHLLSIQEEVYYFLLGNSDSLPTAHRRVALRGGNTRASSSFVSDYVLATDRIALPLCSLVHGVFPAWPWPAAARTGHRA